MYPGNKEQCLHYASEKEESRKCAVDSMFLNAISLEKTDREVRVATVAVNFNSGIK
jgi:hypothetical protein